MVQLNLAEPYAIINSVKVTSINVDPIGKKVYAAVYYCYSKDNIERHVAPVQYGANDNEGIAAIREYPRSGTVVFTGDDYTAYTNYVNVGNKTPEAAVLQILKDRNVLNGTIV